MIRDRLAIPGDAGRSRRVRSVARRAVLDALDSLLIPGATNAELHETLVNVRPAFLAHLRHAESLQQAVGQ